MLNCNSSVPVISDGLLINSTSATPGHSVWTPTCWSAFTLCLSEWTTKPHVPDYKSVAIVCLITPASPSMSSYFNYPRLHDIATQLYADQLPEDQRFHLQNELDDTAVTNVLGEYILAPQSIISPILRLQPC